MPLFDSAILLADGREVYAGPTYQNLPGGALSQDGVMGWLTDVGYPCPMFESPPDYLLDLINTRVEDESNGGGYGKDDAPAVLADAETGKHRDRDVVVKELAAAWIVSERRTAYISDGKEAGQKMTTADGWVGGVSSLHRAKQRGWFAVWCTQFGALFSRTFLYKLREPSVVASQFLNSVLIPLIVGSIYFRQGTGAGRPSFTPHPLVKSFDSSVSFM